jgi:hypothetical protein
MNRSTNASRRPVGRTNQYEKGERNLREETSHVSGYRFPQFKTGGR